MPRRYRIIQLLGEGGFGSVYLAEAEGGELTRPVAIKVLKPEFAASAQMISRLRDEGRLLSRVHHRAIVRVDDLIPLSGRWSVVMEYVDGIDLELALRQGPLPMRVAVAIVAEVANALHAAQIQPGPDGSPLGLLHRDIKPANVRITAAGEIKILDFGVARSNLARETPETQGVIGTIPYMAPERHSRTEGAASDIYSLGVMLFELIFGVRPGESAVDPNRMPEAAAHAARWRSLEQISPPLHQILLDMISFEVESRPSARECARLLERISASLSGEGLADWAERVVPVLKTSAPRRSDTLTGTLMVEDKSAEPAPQWRIWALAGASLSALLLVLVGVGGLGWWMWSNQESIGQTQPIASVSPPTPAVAPAGAEPASATTAPPTAPPPVGQTAEPSTPTASPPAASTAGSSPVTPSKKTSPVTQKTEKATVEEEKAAPPPAPAPTTGRITVTGATSATATCDGKSYPVPGNVPVGTCLVKATLETGSASTKSFSVAAGQTVTITCQKVFNTCDVGG